MGHEFGQVVPDQVLPDDDHHHARGAHVLLHAGVNEAVVRDVAGLGEEHGALVADQHMTLGIGQLVPGHAVDGLVFADVHIVRVLRDIQIVTIRDIAEIAVLAGGGHVDFAILFGLGDGLLGPGSGLHVAGHAVLHQVHGDHGELEGCAALDEQDLVVVGDAHQVTQVLLGFVDDLLVDRGAVAHFHNGHTRAVVIDQMLAHPIEHFGRKRPGSRRKIINSHKLPLHISLMTIIA